MTTHGPSFDIKGKKGIYTRDQHQTDGARIKQSYFGCLLNTNMKPKTKEDAEFYGDEYPVILEEVLNKNDELFRKSIVIVDNIENHPDGRKTFTTHTISDQEYNEKIKHIRSRFKVEIGNDFGKGGRLHLHASFFIVHTTKIQLNLKPIIDAYNDVLEGRGLPKIKYFHVKSDKPSTDLYMTKYNYL
jgi:hypothetical protein